MNTTQPKIPQATRTRGLRVVSGLVVLVALWLGIRVFDLSSALKEVISWIQDLGMLGAAIFVVLYVLACLLMVPGSILTLGAGAVYGVFSGTLLVSLSSVLGAVAAFLTGRHLARDWVARKLAGNARFAALDTALGRESWRIVLLARLSPLLPFNLLNYAFGLTRVSVRHYALASFVGMLPGTLFYVYLGSLAGDLSGINANGSRHTPMEWTFYGVGLVVTIATVIYTAGLAKRAFDSRTDD